MIGRKIIAQPDRFLVQSLLRKKFGERLVERCVCRITPFGPVIDRRVLAEQNKGQFGRHDRFERLWKRIFRMGCPFFPREMLAVYIEPGWLTICVATADFNKLHARLLCCIQSAPVTGAHGVKSHFRMSGKICQAENSSADPITRFDDGNGQSGLFEKPGRMQAGNASTQYNCIVFLRRF